MTIELVTTDGIFALDGGEWEVTNNIWIVGDNHSTVTNTPKIFGRIKRIRTD